MNPDEATSRRLAKLRSMPVDTSRLAARVGAIIPRDDVSAARSGGRSIFRLRPLRAVAASLLLLGTLSFAMFAWTSRPALASADVMARMHEELVTERVPVTKVSSIEEASAALSAQAKEAPDLPSVPADHVMACCMRPVSNKRVACVLMKSGDVPVTMVVANASDIRVPECPMVEVNGTMCHVQSKGRLNMVMTERDGRWVCLIGELPSDQLMNIASRLRF